MEAMLAERVEVSVRGFFTTHHRLQAGAGDLGELVLNGFRRCGRLLTADGRELQVCQTNAWRGWHEMRQGDAVLATARPRGAFRRQVDIEFGGQAFVLEPVSAWRSDWRLVDAAGALLLEVRPRGIFRQGAFVDVHGAVDADLLAFVYYMVYNRWREAAAAAAA